MAYLGVFLGHFLKFYLHTIIACCKMSAERNNSGAFGITTVTAG
jgi:hypothetical protein